MLGVVIAVGTDVSGYIRWFNEISLRDVPLVGGKNASLGELYRELQSAGVRVPNGFAMQGPVCPDPAEVRRRGRPDITPEEAL